MAEPEEDVDAVWGPRITEAWEKADAAGRFRGMAGTALANEMIAVLDEAYGADPDYQGHREGFVIGLMLGGELEETGEVNLGGTVIRPTEDGGVEESPAKKGH